MNIRWKKWSKECKINAGKAVDESINETYTYIMKLLVSLINQSEPIYLSVIQMETQFIWE